MKEDGRMVAVRKAGIVKREHGIRLFWGILWELLFLAVLAGVKGVAGRQDRRDGEIVESGEREAALPQPGDGFLKTVNGGDIRELTDREPSWDEREEVKKVAITFDDGPHPTFTEELLDGLKERGVKASFFVTGEHAALHPDIIKRMYEEGHLVGNHTYTHIQLTSENRDNYRQELIKTNQVLKEITGEEVYFVRPPYGSWDKEFETELDMFPVLWSVDPLDWCDSNAECVAFKVEKVVGEDDIILLHDYYKSSVEAALEIIDDLTQKGYTFVTVDEILFD